MRERVVGSRADSALDEPVLGMVVAVVAAVVAAVVVVVVENDGVAGGVPRWDIGIIEEDGREEIAVRV